MFFSSFIHTKFIYLYFYISARLIHITFLSLHPLCRHKSLRNDLWRHLRLVRFGSRQKETRKTTNQRTVSRNFWFQVHTQKHTFISIYDVFKRFPNATVIITMLTIVKVDRPKKCWYSLWYCYMWVNVNAIFLLEKVIFRTTLSYLNLLFKLWLSQDFRLISNSDKILLANTILFWFGIQNMPNIQNHLLRFFVLG